MAYLPEPPYAHGSPARTGILLVNLGTPDEATARGRAPLPARVPLGPARGRDPARGLVADPARHPRSRGPAKSAAKYAADLDEGRLAAARAPRAAGAAAARLPGRAREVAARGRRRLPLRQSRPSPPASRSCAARAATASSSCRSTRSTRRARPDRRSTPWARALARDAQRPGHPDRAPLPRPPGLREGHRARGERLLDEARAARPPGDELPRPAALLARRAATPTTASATRARASSPPSWAGTTSARSSPSSRASAAPSGCSPTRTGRSRSWAARPRGAST